MKFHWRTELVQLVPIAAMFTAAAIFWSRVPDRMPVHWNIHGEVDGYGGKFMGLLLLPLVALGASLLTRALQLIDPGKANYETFHTTFQTIRMAISLLFSAIYAASLLAALGHSVNMNTIVGLALALMFIVFGNLMGKIRPNWFVGVRTPWTLSSKLSWTKTHRLAGWLFIGMGIMAAVWAIVQTTWMFALMMAVNLGCVVAMVVYSYVIYRGDPARTSPAGTSPQLD